MKDSAGTRAKHRYLLPGDSETDYKLYFQELHRLNYRDFVNVEVSSMIHRLRGMTRLLHEALLSGYNPFAGSDFTLAVASHLGSLMHRPCGMY